jgi:mono/diheme cytochrome c family protein
MECQASGLSGPRPGRSLGIPFTLLMALIGCKGKYIRETSPERFEATQERLLRGQYLVNQVMSCGGCHTSRATGNIMMEGEQTDRFLAGGNFYVDEGIERLYVPNLTSDPDGLGSWSDDEVLRATRDGVDKNGDFLLPMMPFSSYQHLSDEDGKSIVAYLRSVPPGQAPRPRSVNQVKLIPKILFTVVGVQMHAPAMNVPQPDRRDQLGYGRYLTEIAACSDCHSLGKRGPREEGDPMFMAGSDVPFKDARLGKVFARNLTPDPETGIGKYKPADVKAALRNGKRLDGKRMAPPMSIVIPHISGLTDEDMDALVAYLSTLKPAKHAVPEPELTPEAQMLIAP